MRVPDEQIRSLAERLAAAPTRRERRELREAFCGRWGVSDSTVSRWLQNVGHRQRGERSDRGVSRKGITDATVLCLAAIRQASHSRKYNTVTMPTRRVIEIAVDNGLIEPGTISPSYLATRLRDFGLSKAQLQEPSIHNRLQALGPNHVWQLDFTMHSNWKLSNNGFLYREWQGLANRPDDGTEPRLWLAMVTDKATGVYVPFFGRRRGEDTEFALQAFHHAAS